MAEICTAYPLHEPSLFSHGGHHVYAWAYHVLLGLAAAAVGDTIEAATSFRALQAFGNLREKADTLYPAFIAHAAGYLDEAVDLFEYVYPLYKEGGAITLFVLICFDFARTLKDRGAEGDLERARSLATEGLELAVKLGMKLTGGRLERLLEEMGAGEPQTTAYPDDLTQREVDVLCLAAKGYSNRQMAEKLFISIKTVSSHLQNIYNKIGVSNRSEATAYAIRNGLTD